MTTFSRETLLAAHKHSSKHGQGLLRSELCGCFYCLSNFKPDEIAEWINDGANDELELSFVTAICPKCDIDAVLGSASGYDIADKEFLEAMYEYWF